MSSIAASSSKSSTSQQAAWVPPSTSAECKADPDRCLLFKSNRVKQGGAFLSNFWPASASETARAAAVREFGVSASEGAFFDPETQRQYASVEHFFQAWKFRECVRDADYANIILREPTPLGAKQAAGQGRYAAWAKQQRGETKAVAERRFKDAMPSWFAVNRQVMRRALALKFDPAANPSLCRALLATGDRFLAEQKTRAGSVWELGPGPFKNWLGLALMARRTELGDAGPALSASSASAPARNDTDAADCVDRDGDDDAGEHDAEIIEENKAVRGKKRRKRKARN